jgi:hypothetical protein
MLLLFVINFLSEFKMLDLEKNVENLLSKPDDRECRGV